MFALKKFQISEHSKFRVFNLCELHSSAGWQFLADSWGGVLQSGPVMSPEAQVLTPWSSAHGTAARNWSLERQASWKELVIGSMPWRRH
jgi:hypothetical protein